MCFGNLLGNKKCVQSMLRHSFIKERASTRKRKIMCSFGSLFIRLFGYPHLGLRCRVSHILKFLKPKKDDIILDVGCGVGVFSLELAKKYKAKVYGIDNDREDINLARNFNRILNLGVGFSLGNISKLKFKDDYFDKIICSEVLEHVKDDEKAVRELARVLRPKGILVITVPYIIKGKSHYGCKKGHEREGYSLEDTQKLLKQVGLKIIKDKTIYRFFSIIGEKIEERTSKFVMFPFVFLLSKLDIFLGRGNCLIIKARKGV